MCNLLRLCPECGGWGDTGTEEETGAPYTCYACYGAGYVPEPIEAEASPFAIDVYLPSGVCVMTHRERGELREERIVARPRHVSAPMSEAETAAWSLLQRVPKRMRSTTALVVHGHNQAPGGQCAYADAQRYCFGLSASVHPSL